MATWFLTFTGVAASFLVGMQVLGMSTWTVLYCILISNLAAFIALVTTLTLERQPMIKKTWLRGGARTWTFFAGLFFAILLSFTPVLREPRVLGWMIFPLIFGNGFCVFAFGPVQDRLVRRAQRRSRGQSN